MDARNSYKTTEDLRKKRPFSLFEPNTPLDDQQARHKSRYLAKDEQLLNVREMKTITDELEGKECKPIGDACLAYLESYDSLWQSSYNELSGYPGTEALQELDKLWLNLCNLRSKLKLPADIEQRYCDIVNRNGKQYQHSKEFSDDELLFFSRFVESRASIARQLEGDPSRPRASRALSAAAILAAMCSPQLISKRAEQLRDQLKDQPAAKISPQFSVRF